MCSGLNHSPFFLSFLTFRLKGALPPLCPLSYACAFIFVVNVIFFFYTDLIVRLVQTLFFLPSHFILYKIPRVSNLFRIIFAFEYYFIFSVTLYFSLLYIMIPFVNQFH